MSRTVQMEAGEIIRAGATVIIGIDGKVYAAKAEPTDYRSLTRATAAACRAASAGVVFTPGSRRAVCATCRQDFSTLPTSARSIQITGMCEMCDAFAIGPTTLL